MRSITTKTIDEYIAARQPEKRTKHAAQAVSPATINRELRELRAVIGKAVRWGYLPRMPEIGFLREAKRLPPYVTPEHFTALYGACATFQEGVDADWWRGLLVMAYLTGWRIGSLLALRWADVDLDAGIALSRADDNKGGRDQRIDLHTLIVSHLRRLVGFRPCVFTIETGRRQLYSEWHALQDAAGVKPDGKARYGFHDLRRAFATMNVDRLSPETLQRLMQHKDYQTTQRYIGLARQLKPAAHDVFVPDVPEMLDVG